MNLSTVVNAPNCPFYVTLLIVPIKHLTLKWIWNKTVDSVPGGGTAAPVICKSPNCDEVAGRDRDGGTRAIKTSLSVGWLRGRPPHSFPARCAAALIEFSCTDLSTLPNEKLTRTRQGVRVCVCICGFVRVTFASYRDSPVPLSQWCNVANTHTHVHAVMKSCMTCLQQWLITESW